MNNTPLEQSLDQPLEQPLDQPLDQPLEQPLDTSDKLGFPDGLYQYVLKMCFFHPICIGAAFYYGNNLAGILATALSLSSINYWKYPLISSPRRVIDMITAFTVVGYHIYLSLFTKNLLLCAGPLICGALMYPLSLWLCKNNHIKSAVFCHCNLHILVICGAVLTYRDNYMYSSIKNQEQNYSSTIQDL